MLKLVRAVLNAIYLNSPYLFQDGSRISYLAQFDILRYQTGGKAGKVADIGLLYDKTSGLLRIDAKEQWKWRNPRVPLNMLSESGQVLTENERLDLAQKLRLFLAKHPKKYDQFVGVY
jgi:hypothetical protein